MSVVILGMAGIGAEAIARAMQAIGVNTRIISCDGKENLACRHFKPQTLRVISAANKTREQLNTQDNYIIALRNPLIAARAYQSLTGGELELGLLCWCVHLLESIEATHGLRRMVISYELLVHNPERQIERIQTGFNFATDAQQNSCQQSELIDQYHDRLQLGYDALRADPAVKAAILSMDLYECLMKLARDEIKFDSAEFTARWQALMSEYSRMYPMYCYVERLLTKRRRLKKTLALMQQSPFYKLLFPLRMARKYMHHGFKYFSARKL